MLTRSGILGAAGIADYFVDSVAGSDANTGTSQAAPFATIGAMLTAVGSKTNQRVALKCGSMWKEELKIGTAGSPISGTKILAYGTGAVPLIDGSDTIPNANFSLVPTRSFTYTATVSFTSTTTSDQRLLWEDGKCLTQVAYVAGAELATPGTFAYSSYSASSATVLVRASDSSDITSNGKVYDYPKRLDCINLHGDNCRITGARTRRQRNENGSLNILGDYGWIIDCTIEDGHKHCSYNGEGGGYSGCAFKNAYNGTAGFPNYLVFNKTTGSSKGLTVNNCSFFTDPAVAPILYAVSSIICHTSGTFGTLNASGNTHTNGGAAYNPQNIDAINVTGDVLLNCSGLGSATIANLAATFTSCTVTVTTTSISSAVGPFNSVPASGRSALSHVNCTFSTDTYETCLLAGNNVDAVFTGCGLTAGNVSARYPHGLIRLTGTGATLTVNGCSLNSGYINESFYNLAADTVYVGDNNAFVKTTNAHWQKASADVATTMAGWRTYSSQDANSTLT